MKKILTFFLLFLSFLICLSTAKADTLQQSFILGSDILAFYANPGYNLFIPLITSNITYSMTRLQMPITFSCDNVSLYPYIVDATNFACLVDFEDHGCIISDGTGIGQAGAIFQTNTSMTATYRTFYFNNYTIYANHTYFIYFEMNLLPSSCIGFYGDTSVNYLNYWYKNFYTLIYIPPNEYGYVFQADFKLYGNSFNNSNNTNFTTTAYSSNDSFSIEKGVFSKRQCMDDKYFCTNTLYVNSTNQPTGGIYEDLHLAGEGFYCSIDNVSTCENGCLDYVLDLQTSEKTYYQLKTDCSVTQNNVISGFTWRGSCFNNSITDSLASYLSAINPSFTLVVEALCLGNNYITVPKSSCSYRETPYISTTDYLYTQGECYNETPIGDLCSPTLENKTVCADQLHYETCIRDFTGYLSWNVSQPCNSLGFQNYVCQAGRCVYVPPVTPPTPPNHPTTSKGVLYASFLILIFLVLGACAYIGSITGNMGFGITLGIILDLLLLVGSAIDSFPVIGGLVSPSIIIIITIIGLAVIVVYAFIKINH